MSDVLVRGKRLVMRVVLLQTGCALLIACLYFAFRDTRSGLAALMGGLIVALGSALFGWRMFKPGVAGAAALGAAMYTAAALKWVWFAVALYVALARFKLEPVPLVMGLAFAQLGHWLGMLRAK